MALGRAVDSASGNTWLHALRRYFAVVIPGHLAWEFAHLPLYTIWREGTAGETIFAALHCTGGDILIATSTLVLALLLAGAEWPIDRVALRRVLMLTVAFGVGYTIFSEWLNIVFREAWAYTELMPVMPVIDTGLTPLLQWIVVPTVGFWWVSRVGRATQEVEHNA
ncbi:MAG: hypothetical protein ACE5EU_15130 [Paracoccaceae bacterium]